MKKLIVLIMLLLLLLPLLGAAVRLRRLPKDGSFGRETNQK